MPQTRSKASRNRLKSEKYHRYIRCTLMQSSSIRMISRDGKAKQPRLRSLMRSSPNRTFPPFNLGGTGRRAPLMRKRLSLCRVEEFEKNPRHFPKHGQFTSTPTGYEETAHPQRAGQGPKLISLCRYAPKRSVKRIFFSDNEIAPHGELFLGATWCFVFPLPFLFIFVAEFYVVDSDSIESTPASSHPFYS